jgi:hypothetical protein
MEGVLFDQPGTYYVRGIYSALDGSQIVSNILRVVVTSPTSSKDQEVAQLLTGLPQVQLFHLLGSYSPSMDEGNKAFDEVLQNHRDHRLATYVEFVQGIRAATNYKTITEDGKVSVLHKAEPKRSVALLSSAVLEKDKAKELGPITRGAVMRVLAVGKKSIGDEKGAKSTLNQMVDMLSKDIKNPVVLKDAEEQANRSLKSDLRKAKSGLFSNPLI